MKLSRYLISAVLLVTFTQGLEAKNVQHQDTSIEENLLERPGLVVSERDLRGIRDVWAKVRESAIKSWNYIKSVAEKTKERIKIFMENIKEHAMEIKNNFELKLQELKVKLNAVISDLYGTGELVKQCLRKEQENVEDIIKIILMHMSECITEEITNLNQLSSDEPQLTMNETKFLKELDYKMGLCEQDMANVQECFCNVKEDIFNNFTDIENDILKNHYESRNVADDIKGILVACSVNNLIDATNLISSEIIEIAKCVLEAKDGEVTPPNNN